ncbi:hypothetical protein B0H13DRAFT_1923914 [Mycena leptocephala]|nr:hypothetical protein B0H13DRAFT_1923914 [Mycena leptocephala]
MFDAKFSALLAILFISFVPAQSYGILRIVARRTANNSIKSTGVTGPCGGIGSVFAYVGVILAMRTGIVKALAVVYCSPLNSRPQHGSTESLFWIFCGNVGTSDTNTAIDHRGHVPNYYNPRDSSKAKRAFDSHDGMNDPEGYSKTNGMNTVGHFGNVVEFYCSTRVMFPRDKVPVVTDGNSVAYKWQHTCRWDISLINDTEVHPEKDLCRIRNPVDLPNTDPSTASGKVVNCCARNCKLQLSGLDLSKFPECGPELNGKDFKTPVLCWNGTGCLCTCSSISELIHLKITSYLENGYNGQDPRDSLPTPNGTGLPVLLKKMAIYSTVVPFNGRLTLAYWVILRVKIHGMLNLQPNLLSGEKETEKPAVIRLWCRGAQFANECNKGRQEIQENSEVYGTQNGEVYLATEGNETLGQAKRGWRRSTKHGDPWGEQGFVAFTGEDGIRNELRLTLLHEEVGANMANGTSRGKNKAVSRSAGLGDFGDA